MKTKSHHSKEYITVFCILMFIRICLGIIENQQYYDAMKQRQLNIQYSHEEH